MNYIDMILYEFKGQLNIKDIYHMTYKEIGYLRKHREEINKTKAESIENLIN